MHAGFMHNMYQQPPAPPQQVYGAPTACAGVDVQTCLGNCRRCRGSCGDRCMACVGGCNGTEIHGYTLGRELCKGRYGFVRLGHHVSRPSTMYAMKVIPSKWYSPDEVNLQNLLPNHPHVVRVSEVLHVGHVVIVVMEYCSGGDLFEYMHARLQEGPWSEERVHGYFRQMMSVVQSLHQLGVAHQDIKLENFCLADRSYKTLKLGDFGAAERLPRDGTSESCKGHLSPEKLIFIKSGRSYNGFQSDVFQLGAALHEMSFEMREPFPDSRLNPPAGYRPSNALTDLLQSMLCPDPGRRFTLQDVTRHPWLTCRQSPIPMRSSGSGGGGEPQQQQQQQQQQTLSESGEQRSPSSPDKKTTHQQRIHQPGSPTSSLSAPLVKAPTLIRQEAQQQQQQLTQQQQLPQDKPTMTSSEAAQQAASRGARALLGTSRALLAKEEEHAQQSSSATGSGVVPIPTKKRTVKSSAAVTTSAGGGRDTWAFSSSPTGEAVDGRRGRPTEVDGDHQLHSGTPLRLVESTQPHQLPQNGASKGLRSTIDFANPPREGPSTSPNPAPFRSDRDDGVKIHHFHPLAHRTRGNSATSTTSTNSKTGSTRSETSGTRSAAYTDSDATESSRTPSRRSSSDESGGGGGGGPNYPKMRQPSPVVSNYPRTSQTVTSSRTVPAVLHVERSTSHTTAGPRGGVVVPVATRTIPPPGQPTVVYPKKVTTSRHSPEGDSTTEEGGSTTGSDNDNTNHNKLTTGAVYGERLTRPSAANWTFPQRTTTTTMSGGRPGNPTGRPPPSGPSTYVPTTSGPSSGRMGPGGPGGVPNHFQPSHHQIPPHAATVTMTDLSSPGIRTQPRGHPVAATVTASSLAGSLAGHTHMSKGNLVLSVSPVASAEALRRGGMPGFPLPNPQPPGGFRAASPAPPSPRGGGRVLSEDLPPAGFTTAGPTNIFNQYPHTFSNMDGGHYRWSSCPPPYASAAPPRSTSHHGAQATAPSYQQSQVQPPRQATHPSRSSGTPDRQPATVVSSRPPSVPLSNGPGGQFYHHPMYMMQPQGHRPAWERMN